MALPALTAIKSAPVHVLASDMLFAMHDPALCLMPGFFRHVDGRSRDIGCTALKLTYVFGQIVIEANNSSLLGGDELSVLQAIVSLARVHGATLVPGSKLPPHDQQLVTALATAEGDPVSPPADVTADVPASHEEVPLDADVPALAEPVPSPSTVVGTVIPRDAVQRAEFSSANLLEIMGWPDGGAYRDRVDAAIKRLATCVLLIHPLGAPRQWQRYFLLSAVPTNAAASATAKNASRKWPRTHVALNPRLTQILLGTAEGGRYTHISLEEARLLGPDQIPRILHQRLCAWVNAGTERDVSYRKLYSYLWPDDLCQASADATQRVSDKAFNKLRPEQLQRKRMQYIVTALDLLGDKLPGWSVTLASDKPFVADTKLPLAENLLAQAEHARKQIASAKYAADDYMDTIVCVRRGPTGRPASIDTRTACAA